MCVTRFLLLLKDPKGTAAQDASAEQQIKVHQISKEHHLIAPVMKLWKLLLTLSLLFSLLRFAFSLNDRTNFHHGGANNGAKQLRFHRAGLFIELYFFPIPTRKSPIVVLSSGKRKESISMVYDCCFACMWKKDLV